MKKRNIIIISVSVISLIFGGLVFLGVSTFPELLEEEKKEIEQSHEDVLFNLPSNDKNNDEVAAVAVSSNGSSNYIVDAKKGTNSISRTSKYDSSKIVHYEDRAIVSINKEPASHEEKVSNASNEVNAPSTYYKGKSYVSMLKEKEAKNLAVTQKVDNSEALKNRNKNIVNTIVLVVAIVEALAFIFLNKKRHSHKA